MGKDKKHKKSRLDRLDRQAVDPGRLRLVLKVGGAYGGAGDSALHQPNAMMYAGGASGGGGGVTSPVAPPPLRLHMSSLEAAGLPLASSSHVAAPPPLGWHHHKDKKHKKKKKREREKERHKEKRRKEKLRTSGGGGGNGGSGGGSVVFPSMATVAGVVDVSGGDGSAGVAGGMVTGTPAAAARTGGAAAAASSAELAPSTSSAFDRPVFARVCPEVPLSAAAVTAPGTAAATAAVAAVPSSSSSSSAAVIDEPSAAAATAAATVARPGVGRPTMSAGLCDLLALGADTEPAAGRSPLQRLLAYVQHALERKDTQAFFAAPVTDSLAPGYSSIIAQPMDFSTMRAKNSAGQYTDLAAFQEDFRLMCANAMVYNRMDTKYYKAAKRLLHVGCKMMHADKLKCLGSVLPYMAELSTEQLGFEPEPPPSDHDTPMDTQLAPSILSGDVATTTTQMSAVADNNAAATAVTTAAVVTEVATTATAVNNSSSAATVPSGGDIRCDSGQQEREQTDCGMMAVAAEEAEEEELETTEHVRQQAEAAAATAAAKLAQRYRKPPKMGFLRQRDDGTTSLAIVAGATSSGQSSSSAAGRESAPVTIGLLTGKLAQGNPHLAGFREDKRNIAKPVKPLHYGAYCSFAPVYDSTFANISREESDLLLQTYGSETGVQYAQSLQSFTSGCEVAVHMATRLLDRLTDGQHSRTQAALTEARSVEAALQASGEQGRHQQEETGGSPARPSSAAGAAAGGDGDCVNFSGLRSLAQHDIDVSFLDAFEEAERRQRCLQQQLDTNTGLVEALGAVQRQRLSRTVASDGAATAAAAAAPPHYLATPQEQQLADQLCGSLAQTLRQVRPRDVAAVAALHRAMGVGPVHSDRTVAGAGSSTTEEVDVEAVVLKHRAAVSTC